MTTKKAVGQVLCPFENAMAEIRADRNGRFYYVSSVGIVQPRGAAFQTWIKAEGEFFDNVPADKPAANDDDLSADNPPENADIPADKPAEKEEEDDGWL